MFFGLTREEVAAGLDAVAMQILTSTDVAGPPVDAMEVARRLEILVALDDRQQGRARYVRLGRRHPLEPRATILLKPDPRRERRQWAIAHEIGEHAAHRVFSAWGIDPRETAPHVREDVANGLAGRLLLPSAWFTILGAETGWNLLALKSRFSTASHELIARRMLDCPPPVIMTIIDQGAIYMRRSNLAGHAPPLAPIEKQCWRTVHEENRPERASDALRKIQGWPVHEDQWKREILRTEVDDSLDDSDVAEQWQPQMEHRLNTD